MRISDWISDLCSSDLPAVLGRTARPDFQAQLRRVFAGAAALFRTVPARRIRPGAEGAFRQLCADRQRSAVSARARQQPALRSEEHTSELQSLMRTSYAVFSLQTKNRRPRHTWTNTNQHHTSRCKLRPSNYILLLSITKQLK